MKQEIIDLYDEFTHRGLDRRVFMSRLADLAGGTAAAAAALEPAARGPGRCGHGRARRSAARRRHGDHPRGHPAAAGLSGAPGGCRPSKLPAVVVVHENRGLNPHTQDVARRLATDGFMALAVDFLSPIGGTPTDNEDKAREMIGTLDAGKVVTDAEAADRLAQGAARQQRQGRHRRLLLGRRRGRPGRGRGRRPRCRRGLLRPGAGDRDRGRDQGAPALELCRPGRAHQCRRPGVRGGAEGGRQDLHALHVRRCPARLPQRHLRGALQRGRGQARLGAHGRLLQGQPRRRLSYPPQAQLAGRPPPSQAGERSG